MAQLQWTVPGLGLQQYLIGLYHGEESGHLMVHCNNKVILIDFGVTTSKEYSFFLDEELFELQLKLENGHFSYQFIHNSEADTPRNRRIAEDAKNDRWKIGALIFVGLLFVAFVIAHFMNRPASYAEEKAALAAGQGVATKAMVYYENARWHASYLADTHVQYMAFPLGDSLNALGFPLVAGDQFPARYAPKMPRVLHIDWDKAPTPQLERYIEATVERHQLLHPELSIQQVICQIELAFKLEGITGVAKFYQQAQPDFPDYNTNAYYRLVRSSAFKAGLQGC